MNWKWEFAQGRDSAISRENIRHAYPAALETFDDISERVDLQIRLN